MPQCHMRPLSGRPIRAGPCECADLRCRAAGETSYNASRRWPMVAAAGLVHHRHTIRLPGLRGFVSTIMSDHITDLIGWGATLILLLTISSQVYEQWRSRSTQGVSHWLFAGQLAASTGFVAYSVLQGDWVFVVSNVFLLFTALLGQVLYLRNRRRQQ